MHADGRPPVGSFMLFVVPLNCWRSGPLVAWLVRYVLVWLLVVNNGSGLSVSESEHPVKLWLRIASQPIGLEGRSSSRCKAWLRLRWPCSGGYIINLRYCSGNAPWMGVPSFFSLKYPQDNCSRIHSTDTERRPMESSVHVPELGQGVASWWHHLGSVRCCQGLSDPENEKGPLAFPHRVLFSTDLRSISHFSCFHHLKWTCLNVILIMQYKGCNY